MTQRALLLICLSVSGLAAGCCTQLKNAATATAGGITSVANQLSPVDSGRLNACAGADCEAVAKAVAKDLDDQAKALTAAARNLQ